MNSKKPNIVFFFTDDQRYQTFGCFNREIKTPVMDSLVRNGTCFTHACIAGGTSGAVCMPSRAMLHSGHSLFHIDRRGDSIPSDHSLMGETLKQNGYETYGIGKWHNGTDSYSRSFTNGDKIFFGGMDDHWNVPVHSFDKEGLYDKRSYKTNDFMKSNIKREYISDHTVASKHSTDLFADAAMTFIEKHDFEKPMFMYLSFMAPHDPRTMPEKYLDMYDINDIKIPENFAHEHSFDFGIRDIRDELLEAYPRTENAIRKHILEYYAMISHLDDRIGDVIEKMKSVNQYDNTIFILAGDNGLALGQHGLMGKQNLYEHSIRVPLVIQGPAVPADFQSEANVYLYDIFPTLCELSNSHTPSDLDGISLLTFIKGSTGGRDVMYFAYIDSIRAVKKGGYKLIEYRGKNLHKTQLFNLTDDPYETHDLSENESELVSSLRKELLLQAEYHDDLKSDYGKTFFSYW
ncbi:MAG: sulfatase-like hydrolase/transferase [Clostridia bacterium]|nr:sulfatase-like hydrolase/transferase [Clostridia bacterium]